MKWTLVSLSQADSFVRVRLISTRFSWDDFATLPPELGDFFVNFAHIRNDLRIPLWLMQAGGNGMRNLEGIEAAASGHTFQYALRLLSGTLLEGWKFLSESWPKIGVHFEGRLPAEVTERYSRLERYFSSSDNHVRRIRNKLAFHFDPKQLGKVMYGRDGVQNHEIVFGDCNVNIFYAFAEEMIRFVIFDTQDDDTSQIATVRMRKISDEIGEVLSDFIGIADAMLMEIAVKGGFAGGSLQLAFAGEHEVKASDFWEGVPPLFFSEDPEEMARAEEARRARIAARSRD